MSPRHPSSGRIFGTHAEDWLRQRVKAELRKRMSSLRGALPKGACAERSTRIADRLCCLEPVVRAKAIALFWPIDGRHEVDLRAFDAGLRGRGARVAYPRVSPDSRAMTFHFVATPEAMAEEVAYGARLRQPEADEPIALPGALDVIIVPALAVDANGQRIGYGAGCYDRTLPGLSPPATSIAVAFDFQLVAEVPRTPHDVPVDFVVTDARTLKSAR